MLLVALGIALGNWQERRAAQKMAIYQRLAERFPQAPIVLGPAPMPAAPMEFRRVTVTGQFDTAWPIFLENKTYQGRPGSYLVMPFKIADSQMYVLVARGWLPGDPARYDKVPDYPTPTGTVTIEGRVAGSLGRALQLGKPPVLRPNAFVQNLEPAAFAQASGLRLQPFFVEQTGPKLEGEPFVRDWPAPAMGIEKHQGYAFQWYALAAMAFLFFVITGFRSGTKHDG
ncbi:SURF1 family protein [Massilia horti]|uniref:SURF1 family protein n=1 Tax=Massilia horti TaxID=2562153 RepID=UPI0027D97D74|nr:SURF1 family protein [Massilia horti]